MRNTWLVARREFLVNIRKKSFLFAVIGMPIFMGILFAFVIFVTLSAEVDGVDPDSSNVGYINLAADDGFVEQISPPENFIKFDIEDDAAQALEAGEIDAYFIIPQAYIPLGIISVKSYENISAGLQFRIQDYLVQNLAANLDSDASLARLRNPVNYDIYLENTQRELTEAGLVGMFIVPVIFSVVIMIGLQLSSTLLMSGIVEEKTNHIMEILITSIKPMELLAGKILGLSALGMIQILVWIIMGGVLLAIGGNNEFLSSVEIPLDFVLLAIVYFFLTYLMFASLLAGIGAVVGSEEESRQYAGILSLVVAVPFFFFVTFLTDPNSPIITALTFIPFTSAMTVILKTPFAPVPPEQIMVSLAILILTTIFIIWISSKIFRWGLLMYGKKLGIRTIWKVIRGSQDAGVIPAQGGQA